LQNSSWRIIAAEEIHFLQRIKSNGKVREKSKFLKAFFLFDEIENDLLVNGLGDCEALEDIDPFGLKIGRVLVALHSLRSNVLIHGVGQFGHRLDDVLVGIGVKEVNDKGFVDLDGIDGKFGQVLE
jgi:hypothetical protein